MNSQLNGILLLDKPKDWTSHDLVHFVRKLLNTKEVGHCGTLDPLATGLMVLLLGEATKLSNYILDKKKTYILKGQLGIETDTLDITGKVLETRPVDISVDELQRTALTFQGDFFFPVPMYSATKVDGVRLYDLARKGENRETPIKPMSFFDLKWISGGQNCFELEISCSKGSFIRSWVHEFGKRHGCGATLLELRRTASWPYSIDSARTTSELEEIVHKGVLHEIIIPMFKALPDYKTIRVSGMDESLILNGQISYGVKSQLISLFQPGVDHGVKIISQKTSELRALVGLEEGKGFVIRRVFRC